jgi:hypothetical protein
MWRSSLGGCVAVLASAVLISACSNDSRNSTEPVVPPVSESIVPAGCPTVTQTAQMIVALYPKGADRVTAAAAYAAILLYINTHHQADAQTLMFRLLDFTLQRYNAGKLIGGYSATTQQQLLAFEIGLYCTVGLPTTGLVLPGTPTDPGTVNKVVLPSTTIQNIVTQNGKAGVQFPGGSLLAPVLVTISPAADKPLHTSLDQYGPYSDVKVSPESSLNTNVSVGLCLDDGADIATVFLAHNISTTAIEVLPRGVAVISGLCGVTEPPAPTSLRTAFNLGTNGDFASATKVVGSAIADMLLPTNANATGGGVTGTTRKFSPFGGVDTKVYMTANSPTSQNAPAGSAVTSPPSALVKTHLGALVAQVNVLFSVTSGDGTVTPTSAIATDATGVATLSSWVINAGSNTVQAVGTYADPAVTFALSTDANFPQTVAVDPAAGITFTATGGDIVPYGSSYSYFTGVHDVDQNFEAPDFPATDFSTGSGAFGTAGTSTCPLFSDTAFPLRTSWPINTDLLLRKTFSLPHGWSKPLTVSAAIDNDIAVYVNGTPVTPFYHFTGTDYAYDASSGFVTHENCATKGTLGFDVSSDLLHEGQNVLAIRARDRGGVNYVDVKVSVQTPQ